MVHPKLNTADGAKSVSHLQIFTGRKATACVAAAWRCKRAQPPGHAVGHPTDGDGGLAEVAEASSVGEHKRDRQNPCHAGYDHHAGHGLGVRRHFHADHHLGFRRHFHAGVIWLHARSGDHSAGHGPATNVRGGPRDARPIWQLWLSEPLAAGAAAQALPFFDSTSSE
jgi:hypothetical protein